jgi:tetraprenyl-beta-curcumene synthase
VSAAARYWIGVFPLACREIRRWEQAARAIPDLSLRTIALRALGQERGNLEGAAAYAAFTPRPHRVAVARAAMAFQAVYDYVDALSEQPGSGHVHNIDQLHQALLIALSPDALHLDYYAYEDRRDDGGYLNCLVDSCRSAVGLLPSLAIVAPYLRRATLRIVTYQRLNHQSAWISHHSFACWARSETDLGSELRWWETAAAAGSSLTVFALLSAAAQPTLDASHAAALECAYFPWIGSLHTLLDSLVDEHEDKLTKQHCLTARYASRQEAASRLETIALRASEQAKALPDGGHHTRILAAMVSFYLASPQANDPRARLAAERVLRTLGDHALPTMFVLRVRRAMSHLL